MTKQQIALKYVILSAILFLSSCDMSRWYFRHGGKNCVAKSQTENVSINEFRGAASVRAIHRDTVLFSNEDQINDFPESADNKIVPHFAEKASEKRGNGSKSVKIKVRNDLQKRSGSHNSSTAAKRMHTNPGPLILLIVLVFILGLALIGTLIFLISWIFVPIAIALRIALWGLLIVFGLYVLLFLGLLLFSN